MGRGLSDLQKRILLIARDNHVGEGRDLPTYDVLVAVAGWPDVTSTWGDGWHINVKRGHAVIAEAMTEMGLEPVSYWGATPEVSMARDIATRREAEDYAASLVAGVTWSPRVTLPYLKVNPNRRGVDVNYAEVLAAVYGFTDRWGQPARLRRADGELRYGQHFSRTRLGAGRYDAAVVAVSKACGRLEARGLVVCVRGGCWAGVDLTETGLELAECLTAKNDNNIMLLSH